MGGEKINIVSYGGGANSTALLVGLHKHRIPVDLILFADTGGEHPHTYSYLEVMDQWLKDHGMPTITRVYKTTRDGKRLALEDECLQSGTLPSIAYGFKRCSLKHKIGPQEKFCNNYPPCREVWDSGKKVVKFIGYDAGESYANAMIRLLELTTIHTGNEGHGFSALGFLLTKRRIELIMSKPKKTKKVIMTVVLVLLLAIVILFSMMLSRGHFYPYPAYDTDTEYRYVEQ